MKNTFESKNAIIYKLKEQKNKTFENIISEIDKDFKGLVIIEIERDTKGRSNRESYLVYDI